MAKLTKRHVCEVFTNIFRHANSVVGGVALGQVYPNAGRLQISIYDLGVGLVRKIQRMVPGVGSAPDAINWALAEGNSTAEGPGGLGLTQVRQFVEKNGGYIRIYANEGRFSESAKGRLNYIGQSNLEGTMVDLGLNILCS